jgi:hypothetical protein
MKFLKRLLCKLFGVCCEVSAPSGYMPGPDYAKKNAIDSYKE